MGLPIVERAPLRATWCPPCASQMPLLLAAQQRHPGVHFVLVNQGEESPQVAAWLARRELPLRNVLLDPKREASATFRQQGYPRVSQGRIADNRGIGSHRSRR